MPSCPAAPHPAAARACQGHGAAGTSSRARGEGRACRAPSPALGGRESLSAAELHLGEEPGNSPLRESTDSAASREM